MRRPDIPTEDLADAYLLTEILRRFLDHLVLDRVTRVTQCHSVRVGKFRKGSGLIQFGELQRLCRHFDIWVKVGKRGPIEAPFEAVRRRLISERESGETLARRFKTQVHRVDHVASNELDGLCDPIDAMLKHYRLRPCDSEGDDISFPAGAETSVAA